MLCVDTLPGLIVPHYTYFYQGWDLKWNPGVPSLVYLSKFELDNLQ